MKRKIYISLSILIVFYQFSQAQKLNIANVLNDREIVYSTRFFDADTKLAVNLGDQLQIYDSEKFSPLYSISTKPDFSCFDAVSSGKSIIIGDKQGFMYVFEDNTIRLKSRITDSKLSIVKLGRSGKNVAFSDIQGSIGVTDLESNHVIADINLKDRIVTDIKFTLDEAFILISTNRGEVFIWDYINDEVIKKYTEHKRRVRAIALSPDSLTFATCGDDRRIIIYSLKNFAAHHLEKKHRNMIVDIAFINNNFLLSIGHDNQVVLSNINSHNYNYSFEYRPNGWLPGDYYLNDVDLSDQFNQSSISTLGKGVYLTNSFHDFIKCPHTLQIGIENTYSILDYKKENEFSTKKDSVEFTGSVYRTSAIKELWLYDKNYNKKIPLTIDIYNRFIIEVPINNMINNFSILIEDIDKNLETSEYQIKVIKEL